MDVQNKNIIPASHSPELGVPAADPTEHAVGAAVVHPLAEVDINPADDKEETYDLTGLDDLDDPDDDFDGFSEGDTSGEDEPGMDNHTLVDYFLQPEEIDFYRVGDGLPPIDPSRVDAWFRALTPAEQANLIKQRQEIAENNERNTKLNGSIHERLTTNTPELYEGSLPPGLVEHLEGKRFAVGFNQSGASDIKEARAYLKEAKGIDVTGFNIMQRFSLMDNEMGVHEGDAAGTNRVVEAGYFGIPVMGRFVVAFPIEHPFEGSDQEQPAHVINNHDEVLPEDFYTYRQSADGTRLTSVSPKYLAGYIDDEGSFWKNTNFYHTPRVAFEPYDRREELASKKAEEAHN